MTDALKPCPFCGDKPTLHVSHRGDDLAALACENDQCSIGPATDYLPDAQLAAAWNTRQPADHDAEIETAVAFSSGWEAAMCFVSDRKEQADVKATERKCANCMWWTPFEVGLVEAHQCRALPPTQGGLSRAKWPLTYPIDWCGAFRFKEPEA